MGVYIKQQGSTVVLAYIVAVVKVDIPSLVFAQIALSSSIGGLWLTFS